MIHEEDADRRRDAGDPELLDLLDGEWTGPVLGDGDVDGGHHDLSGPHDVETGVGGEDLLGQRQLDHACPPLCTASVTAPLGAASGSLLTSLRYS